MVPSMTDLYDQRRALIADAVEALNQERYDQRIDEMYARERQHAAAILRKSNITGLVYCRAYAQDQRNAARLTAYKRKRALYD
jgi:hypothetical protein